MVSVQKTAFKNAMVLDGKTAETLKHPNKKRALPKDRALLNKVRLTLLDNEFLHRGNAFRSDLQHVNAFGIIT